MGSPIYLSTWWSLSSNRVQIKRLLPMLINIAHLSTGLLLSCCLLMFVVKLEGAIRSAGGPAHDMAPNDLPMILSNLAQR